MKVVHTAPYPTTLTSLSDAAKKASQNILYADVPMLESIHCFEFRLRDCLVRTTDVKRGNKRTWQCGCCCKLPYRTLRAEHEKIDERHKWVIKVN